MMDLRLWKSVLGFGFIFQSIWAYLLEFLRKILEMVKVRHTRDSSAARLSSAILWNPRRQILK